MDNKRAEDKKIIIKALSIVFFVLLWVSLLFICLISVLAYAIGGQPIQSSEAYIEFSDAPEGTYYVDILAKIDSSAKGYTEFNAAPKECMYINDQRWYSSLPVSRNSEIAQYNEDGYVSIISHLKGAKMILDSHNTCIDLDSYIEDGERYYPHLDELYLQYGDMKAAFVDREGNVLGITSQFQQVFNNKDSYKMTVSGDTLEFSCDVVPRIYIFGFCLAAILVVLLPPIGIMILVVGTVRRRLRRKRMQIQAKE